MPVRSEDAGSAARKMRFLSAATPATASEEEEAAAPTIMSTLSASNHLLAIEVPISALFWTSAWINSIFLPRTVPPKS